MCVCVCVYIYIYINRFHPLDSSLWTLLIVNSSTLIRYAKVAKQVDIKGLKTALLTLDFSTLYSSTLDSSNPNI